MTNDFSGPKIPEKFLSDLKALDPTLLVRWNDRKRRFTIEQCTLHHASPEGHNYLCERIYVLLVQDPEGGMMGLGDAVLDMIRARDVTKVGYGPERLRKFQLDMQRIDEENRALIDRKQTEAIKACSRDNRRQLLKSFRLLSRCGTPNR